MLSFTRLRSGPAQVTLAVDDTAVVRRFGRPSALGKPERIECGSSAEARRTQHRIAQRLMRKGYVAGHHHPGLIEAIAARPDDPAGYAVYADWLAQRGDPRAALIEATRTPKHSHEIRRLLDAHPYHFQHDLWRSVDAVWWMGFVRGFESLSAWSLRPLDATGTRWTLFDPGIRRLLTWIRTHPSGRFLRDFRGSIGAQRPDWQPGDGHWTACYRTVRGRLSFDRSVRPARIELRGALEPVPVNTAPLGLLMQLPHVGRREADAVVARRKALGGFTTLGQLASVPYLGGAALDSLHTHGVLARRSMLDEGLAG